MKLEKIRIKNFRCFRDAEISFGKKLTLIFGKNSSGKSCFTHAPLLIKQSFESFNPKNRLLTDGTQLKIGPFETLIPWSSALHKPATKHIDLSPHIEIAFSYFAGSWEFMHGVLTSASFHLPEVEIEGKLKAQRLSWAGNVNAPRRILNQTNVLECDNRNKNKSPYDLSVVTKSGDHVKLRSISTRNLCLESGRHDNLNADDIIRKFIERSTSEMANSLGMLSHLPLSRGHQKLVTSIGTDHAINIALKKLSASFRRTGTVRDPGVIIDWWKNGKFPPNSSVEALTSSKQPISTNFNAEEAIRAILSDNPTIDAGKYGVQHLQVQDNLFSNSEDIQNIEDTHHETPSSFETDTLFDDPDFEADENLSLEDIEGDSHTSESKEIGVPNGGGPGPDGRVQSASTGDYSQGWPTGGQRADQIGTGERYLEPIILATTGALDKCFFIEEPETNLHPSLQSSLTDWLISIATERRHQFVLETHSENILLRVMRRLKEGVLKEDEVCIYYVEQDSDGVSTASQLSFNKDASFVNPWPPGFFEDRQEDIFSL